MTTGGAKHRERRSLGGRLGEALAAAPKQPFVIGGASRGEVHALALELRDRLLAAGPPGEPICLATDDRVAVAAALLASLAGGPPLVVPHAGTAPAVAAAFSAAGCRRAVGDDRALLPRGAALVRVRGATGTRGPARPVRPLDEPFLRLYTGGSTGAPRAWSKTPANLLAEAHDMTGRFAFGPQDRIVASVSPRHIYGLLFSVLVPLVSGASVLRDTPFFPGAIASELARLGASVLVSVPAQLRALGGTRWTAPRLRLALSSTAPLEAADAAAFAARASVGVTEIFGSTETGGIAVRCRQAGDAVWRVLDGVDCRVVRGRLQVRSPYLSPDLPRGVARWFRTADRAQRAPGGFELLGRADGVVKVGGRRVDVGEVEACLRALPGVREALVWARAVPRGRGKELVGLFVGPGRPELLLRALRRRLPAAAVPRRLAVVDRLPTTAAGKPDREAAEQRLAT